MGLGVETVQLRVHRFRAIPALGRVAGAGAGGAHDLGADPGSEAGRRGRRPGADRDANGETARVPGPGVPRQRVSVRGAGPARASTAGSLSSPMPMLSPDLQLLNALAALLLLLSFAMLAQRRIVTLVNLLALQGAVLCAATLLLAWRTRQGHLYLSAALTLLLKVIVLPRLLHRLIRRLGVYWDAEPLLNITGTMLLGLIVVVFAFGLAAPVRRVAGSGAANAHGLRGGGTLPRFLALDPRRQGIVAGGRFLVMENGLFFGAMSATYGMPMIVEFGVALDVLVAMLVLGVFLFQ